MESGDIAIEVAAGIIYAVAVLSGAKFTYMAAVAGNIRVAILAFVPTALIGSALFLIGLGYG